MSWVAENKWLEISFFVNGEIAEAVSDVLSRYVSTGIVIENQLEYKDDDIKPSTIGLTRVFGYIPADSRLNETQRSIEEAIWHLSQIEYIPKPEYRSIKDENWMEAWKKNYHPILVGEKMLILPAWMDNNSQSRIPIRINPGMAFGTGTHPTTQLCIQAIEEFIFQGKSIIDVGCGSGILSIAATLLGSDYALAIDIDKESISLTKQNAEINNVKDKITVAQGSVEQIIAQDFPIRSAPIVVANILAPIILKLLDAHLVDLVDSNGYLILSGILEDQETQILEHPDIKKMNYVKKFAMGDWVAMIFHN